MGVNWKAKTFSASNAEFLGKTADLTYENKTSIAKTAKAWNMKLDKSFKHKETQAHIIGDDETLILAFRGTEITEVTDITTALDAKLVSGFGGKVHQGFRDALPYISTDL